MARPTIDTRAEAQRASNPATRRSPNIPLFVVLMVGAALVAVGFLLRFPNLLGNPLNLTLVALTPLLGGAVIALVASRLGGRLPGRTQTLVRGALALVVLADLVVFAGPLVVRGNTGHDSAPVFAPATTAQATQPAAVNTPTPAPLTLSGAFDHRPVNDTVSGSAILGATASGAPVLRLENLQATNGPDLYVYLSKTTNPTTNQEVMDGLEVGRLKATTGASNYDLPAATDITQYKSVVVYCKSFSVIFGVANLA